MLPSKFFQSNLQGYVAGRAAAGCRGKGGKSLVMKVPAVAANLGPGFDSVALALSIYSQVTVEILPHPDATIPMVQLSGAIRTASDASAIGNLVYTLLSKICLSRRHLLQHLKILVESDLPLNRGLGVSDGIILAALYAVNSIEDLILGQADLLSQSIALEVRAESAAAALLGDLVISAESPQHRKVFTQQLYWPPVWHLFCVIPPYSLDTIKMRALIPPMLPTASVIHNLQRLSIFLASVNNCNDQALKEGLIDHIHEPYRRHRVPELDSLSAHLKDFPILGCVLSGAGPAVLIIYHVRHKQMVRAEIEKWMSARSSSYTLLDLQVERQGMLELSGSSNKGKHDKSHRL
ncbi:MAG: hypothetical protein IPK73_05365 [Candidatus Obscuribacter sp.]|nr:hypothetical protein [Candidatus Obscuribacter sp.]